MDALGRYLNLDYQRVSRGGQWHIIQANTVGGKDWAMWTNGANTYVSPVYRFYNAVQARMCYVHERGHVGGDRSHGGSGLMNANGGYLLTEYDMRRFQGTPWKSALRPWHEPDWFKSYLKTGVVGSPFGSPEDEFRLLGH